VNLPAGFAVVEIRRTVELKSVDDTDHDMAADARNRVVDADA
jgi:hypothetical protein